MGDAVECEYIAHDQYDVAGQLKVFIEAGADYRPAEHV